MEVTSALEQEPLSSASRDKLEFLYSQALSLLTYEGTLFTSRSGHAITTQAILFSAFFFVMNTANIGAVTKREAELLICGSGIIFLLSYALLVARNLSAASFWRSRLIQIEQDARFWVPAGSSQYVGLDIFGCRSRLLMQEAPDTLGTSKFRRSVRDSLLSRMNRLVRDPLDFYTIYFPAIFSVIWTILAISSLAATPIHAPP